MKNEQNISNSLNSLFASIPDWKTMKVEGYRLNLIGLEVYKQLPPEVIEEEWNGIGPDRLPKWMRVALSNLHRCVLPAACIHDLRFVIGGNKDAFHAANKEMKKNMRTCLKASRKEFSWFGYWKEKREISIAYKLCEKYGFEGWHYIP